MIEPLNCSEPELFIKVYEKVRELVSAVNELQDELRQDSYLKAKMDNFEKRLSEVEKEGSVEIGGSPAAHNVYCICPTAQNYDGNCLNCGKMILRKEPPTEPSKGYLYLPNPPEERRFTIEEVSNIAWRLWRSTDNRTPFNKLLDEAIKEGEK